MKRDSSISICKGLAIILMVIGHAEAPGALSAFIYEFHISSISNTSMMRRLL